MLARIGARGFVVGVLLPILLVAMGPASGAAGPAVPLAQDTQVDPDSVLLRATLQPDGTANWEVAYRIRLDDANATGAFDSLQADIRANRSEFEAQFADRMQPTVDAGENASGRDMAIRDVSVTTSRQTLGQEYGVVTYAFEWIGFAVADGSRIEAGDALAGMFLDSETSLTIAWPSPYHAVTVQPQPTETGAQSVTWAGRLDFAGDEPVLVVEEGPTSPSTVTTSGPGPVDGDSDGGDGLDSTMLAIVGLVVIAALGVGGWLYTRRRGPPSAPDAEPEAQEAAAPPDDLLSNEERVLQLLSEHGGRLKQQQVAEELGWTDAKTSQVVSTLREDDEIQSFRLGRENVLTLPDHDLTGQDEGDEE